MSSGIVSATGSGTIETDAPIDAGEVGAPILDRFGRLRAIRAGPDGGSVWQGRVANTYVPNASRPTVVYLPPGFDPRYPVSYLLQGFRTRCLIPRLALEA
jgi:hypothetical protein